MYSNFHHISTLLEDPRDFCKETRRALRTFKAANEKIVYAQLCAIIDAGECFVQATYTLEGDMPLGPIVFDQLERISSFVEHPLYPRLDMYLVAVGGEEAVALRQRVMAGLQPMYDHFNARFKNDFDSVFSSAETLKLFEAIGLANPAFFLRQYDRGVERVRELLLRLPHHVNALTLASLMSELEMYKSAAEANLRATVKHVPDLPSWWLRQTQLPAWREFAVYAFLAQPSSACVERVFSFLANILSDEQINMLSDSLRVILLGRYNDVFHVNE